MTVNPFIQDAFCLENETARRLYHEFATTMPIVDYHCHLPPKDVSENHQFENIGEAWLHGDHYKWRAMRTNGVPEKYCTGDATDREKFQKWAETVPSLLRNPLYVWNHLELKSYFNVDALLGPDTAEAIWEQCNSRLSTPEYRCRGLMEMSNVRLVCTTDDPVDTLEAHRLVAEDPDFAIQMLPCWRPDKAMAMANLTAFNGWMDKLSEAADMEIGDYNSLIRALRKRHQHFADHGCRMSDHGLETVYAETYTHEEVEKTFARARSGKDVSPSDIAKYQSALLQEFAEMDHEKGWVQQFHLGAMRNNNTRMFQALGPDTGFDSIGDYHLAEPLSRMLDKMDQKGCLPKTILYNLNPRDNYTLSTMLGNFQDGETPGKMQWGSGWWFLDQKDGMEAQLNTLSQTGLLSRFVGMLTDSRSFLSYPRHEYFRRILCNLLGADVEKGLIPDDDALLAPMIKDICYNNAVRYFGFDLPEEK